MAGQKKLPENYLFCLSSSATPRYHRNVIQVLGAPIGSRANFRYSNKIVDPNVWNLHTNSIIVGCPVILAYLDNSTAAREICALPYRMATVTGSESRGSTLTLTFSLGDFVSAPESFAIDNGIALPQHEGGSSKNYCQFISSDVKGLSVGADSWEETVSRLYKCYKFKDEVCFYQVSGLYQLPRRAWEKGSAIHVQDGFYNLKYGREYELRIYHYHEVDKLPVPSSHGSLPSRISNLPLVRAFLGGYFKPAPDIPHPQAKQLERFNRGAGFDVQASPPISLLSRSIMMVDSPYDIKRVRFKVGAADHDCIGTLSLLWRAKSDEDFSIDYDIPFKAKGLTARSVGIGAVAGLGLSLPPIVDLVRKRVESSVTKDSKGNPTYPTWNQVQLSQLDYAVILCYASLYILVGMFAAFKIRKPI